MMEAGNAIVPAGNHASAIEVSRHRAMEDVLDKSRLAATRHSGDGHEHSERNLHIEAAQIVLARALDPNHPRGVQAATHFGNRDLNVTAQIAAGYRVRIGADLLHRAFGDHKSPVLPCAGPKIN